GLYFSRSCVLGDTAARMGVGSAVAKALTHSDIAELLAREAGSNTGILGRAFRRAARSAFLWPEQVHDLLAANRKLTELHGVGPFITKQIHRWIDNPPELPLKVPAIRRDFLALAYALK